jgi:ATP-dependent DNA helicase RecG
MTDPYRFLNTPIEFLKGIGPQRAAVLGKEMGIFTFGDLLCHFPFRYEDRSYFTTIAAITGKENSVQLKGEINYWEILGEGRSKRLTAYLHDGSDSIELVWFKGIEYIAKNLKKGATYIVFGKPALFRQTWNIAHPELELFIEENFEAGFEPVYNTSEKMKRCGLDTRSIKKAIGTILNHPNYFIPESFSEEIRDTYALCSRSEAFKYIHAPENMQMAELGRYYFKFEELFYFQLSLHKRKSIIKSKQSGWVFNKLRIFNEFYTKHLPFALTNAQKRVIKEMHADMKSGRQMNRLLQGDVGSGKTMVAFLLSLIAIDNGHQCCLMAPTEILAQQHFEGLNTHAQKLGLTIGLLTGSTPKKERADLFRQTLSGDLKLLIGTHALLEEQVKFQSLGLCIIDEQHRFGVAQRATLWRKNDSIPPHILVMTATPIPRTLAMTLYGDLELSIIDELPPGRKAIQTVHRSASSRAQVYQFLRNQLAEGRQVYIVYPLIEESEKLDYQNLMDGVEQVRHAFSEYEIAIVHGRMKPAEKEQEMSRFVNHEAHIMVATTVIEVGVNVPNASVMLIENAERFGLSQLHQLRGRVGRGAAQSYCILLSGNKISKEGKLRLETMVRTNDGFEIADVDLKLRGPGDVMGTQQSGITDLTLTDFSKDQGLIEITRDAAIALIKDDENLEKVQNQSIALHFQKMKKDKTIWAAIS